MKKYIIFCITISLIFNVRAQLLTPLGNGIQEEVLCSAHDSKGRLTIGIRKSQDSVAFKMWDPSTKTWSHINTIKTVNYWSFRTRCIYKNDSLFVSAKGVLGNEYPNALFYVSKTVISMVGEFKSKFSSYHSIFGLHLVHNQILVLGSFDSVIGPSQRISVLNAALFDGTYWKSAGNTFPYIITEDMQSQSVEDTVICSYYTGSYKYEYPASWVQLNTPEYVAGKIDNKIVLWDNYDDSVQLWYNNKLWPKQKVKGRVKNNTYFRVRLGNSYKGTVLATDRYLYKFDLSTATMTPIYRYGGQYDSFSNGLISNDSHVYFNNYSPIYFKSINLTKIAEIDLDSVFSFGFDTVVVFPYWDKNNNAALDPGDDLFSNFSAYNNTYNYYNYSGGYTWTDILPDYEECEYSIPYYNNSYPDTCLKLKFTGNVKSKNLTPGVTRDTVFFPFQRTSLKYTNLAVANCSRPRARLMDTTYLNLYVFHRDCDYNNASPTLKIVFQKNTQFIDARPYSYTTNGDTVVLSLNNISPDALHSVQLRVLYPNSLFAISDTVRHKVVLDTLPGEDTADNKAVIYQVMSYSLDPNHKYSIPEGVITKDLKEINYHIDFENEGNDYAERVTVIDTLDTVMPVYEFQMNGASHPYSASLRGNVITWTFDKIYLTPKKQDSLKSKGYISFKARVNGNLKTGDSIRNRAAIYFDYNKPVITNFAVIRFIPDTTTAKTLTTHLQEKHLRLFPNPAQNEITLQNQGAREQTIWIYNLQGQKIWQGNVGAGSSKKLSTSALARGIYIARDTNGTSLKFILQ